MFVRMKNNSAEWFTKSRPEQLEVQVEIHNRAMGAAKNYRAAETDLLDVLAEVETHKVHLHFGCSSLFQYALSELKLSESVVSNLIYVMRTCKKVPELKEHVKSGAITLSNARRIAAVIQPENKNEWLQKASDLSSRKLEKEIARVQPQLVVQERSSYVTAQRLKIEIGMFENQLLLLRKAQDLVSSSQGRAASLEETVVAMTDFYLKNKDPVRKAKRVIAKKGLVSGDADSHVTRHVPELQSERTPIPAATLHQVHLRDQKKCAFKNHNDEICGESRWTEIHHIRPVSQGGKNVLENLVTLCSAHHKWIHESHKGELGHQLLWK